MRKLFNWLIVLSLTGFLSACAAVGARDGNIAEVAQKNGFTALLAAVDKAGIASTLTDPKANLTVFAPTDTDRSESESDSVRSYRHSVQYACYPTWLCQCRRDG